MKIITQKEIVGYKVFVRANKKRWHSPYFLQDCKIKKGTILQSTPKWGSKRCGPGISVWKISQGAKRCARRQLVREGWHEVSIWRCIIPVGSIVIIDPKWNRCRASMVVLKKKLATITTDIREDVVAELSKLKLRQI